MKKIFYLSLITFISVFAACKNPTDDITIIIEPNVFNYSTAIKVEDVAGNALPTGLKVEISGPDADAIYTMSGTKDFKVQDGYIYTNVDPHRDPTANNPIEFSVKVSGDAILDVNIPFEVNSGQSFQMKPIKILNLNNPPVGAAVSKPVVTLATLAAEDQSISTNTSASLITRLELEAGTQFLNAAGQVLTGDNLSTVLVNLDPRTSAGIALFPGGSLSSSSIVNAAGQTIEGAFNPAAVTSIEFFINEQGVKSFNKPVTVYQNIDPTYVNPNTNALVKAGDFLEIYSYEVETGTFKYERSAEVILQAGKLSVSYPIEHLTIYIAGYLEGACPQANLNLVADWMTEGVSYPLNIKFVNGAEQIISEQVISISTNNAPIAVPAIPSGSRLIITHPATGQVYFDGAIDITCGSVVNVALANIPQQPVVTMQLFVRCPGKTANVEALPTFQLYYRLAGSNGSFLPLGEVVNGFISTTSLDVTKRYDFRGVWNDKIKTVGNKAIEANNTGTVGNGPGLIIGEVAPANNLQMLTEACAEIGQ
ncbi:hypothetical protein [Arcticibacter sp.]|uniref:hypothetical protein n=1 Tax=Arcticibacter sp. TaxID=1872630 RepID=UPI00388EE7ED